eukprot:1777116-Lingulodinium_polyedra.AAC.1
MTASSPDRKVRCPNQEHFLRSRYIAGVLRPLFHATEVLQSDSCVASTYLPCLTALEAQLKPSVPVQVAGSGMNPQELEEVEHGVLDEVSQRL